MGKKSRHNECKEKVFMLLKEKTNSRQHLTATEIENILHREYSINCERKTVSRALKDLRDRYGQDEEGEWLSDEYFLHYTVTSRKTGNVFTDYWIEEYKESLFSDEELFFLMDSVLYSKHISQRDANEIINKLKGLSDHPGTTLFSAQRSRHSEYRTDSRDLLFTIGVINEAIEAKVKVAFFENRYGLDKELHHTTPKKRVISPYRLIMSEDNYYLIGSFDEKNRVDAIRVDKISEIEILEKEKWKEIRGSFIIRENPEKYLLDRGPVHSGAQSRIIDATLIMKESTIDELIDTFGKDIDIEDAQDSIYDDVDDDADVTVRVKASFKELVQFILKCAPDVRLVGPRTTQMYLSFLYATLFYQNELDAKNNTERIQ